MVRVLGNPLYEPTALLGFPVGPRSKIPNAILQRLRAARLAIGALLLLGIGGPSALLALGLVRGVWIGKWWFLWLWLAVYVPTAHIWPWLVNKRFVRSLEENGLRLCVECGHSLRGLPDQHVCPECGQAYRIIETERVWSRWLEVTGCAHRQ